MNFFLVSSILLLVPLAFANVSPSVEIKLIYDTHFVITEFQENTNGHVDYYATLDDSEVKFNFGVAQNNNVSVSIADHSYESPAEAKYSLVVEKMKVSDSQEFDCKKNSDPSLRHLIQKCIGTVALRKPTKAEKRQIEEFKKNQEEINKQFQVTADNGKVVGKSTNLKGQAVTVNFPNLEVQNWGTKDPIFINHIQINGMRKSGQRFIVEGSPSERGCALAPPMDLEIVKCRGKIKVRSLD